MRRREVLKTLPALAVGAAVASRELFAQSGRRIPLGIQYGGAGATPDANKMKMEMFKQIGYDLIEPVNMNGFDPTLFRKQADEVGLGLYSIHITTANTAPRGQGAGPAGGGRGGGQAAGGAPAGAPAGAAGQAAGGGQPGGGAPAGAGGGQGGGRGGGGQAAGGGQAGAAAGGAAGGGRGGGGGAPAATAYAKNGRPLHSQVVVGQDTTYNNEGILSIVRAQAPILRDLGVTYGVLGATSITSYSTVDGLKRMSDVYNQAHKILRAVGVNLSYHTHEWELWPVQNDGRMGVELVMQNTDSAIKAQIDIGWAAWGGADVVSFIRNHANRIALLHMRDYKDGAVTTAGEGVFDWPGSSRSRR